MQVDLTGKIALVTGSSKGIGLAAARQLARSGAEVILHGRDVEALDQACRDIGEESGNEKVSRVIADIGTAEGCDKLAKAARGCDILVNNAGIFGPCDYFETDDETWQRYFDINVMSGVRLSRALAPAMVDKGWGRIVFLSSESAFNIPADMVHYGVTKTAYTSLARGLAKRLAGTGVTVNSVLPGPTLSEGVKEMLKGEADKTGKSIEEVGAEFVKSARPSSVIQRMATVDEVANMILYACSPESSATSGASLRVEGGVVDTL